MRFAERELQAMCLRRRGAAHPDAWGEPAPDWGPPVRLRAVLQPAASALDARLYGEQARRMLRAYCPGGVELAEGDGLCVEVPGDATPDARVVSVQRWADHLELEVERLQGPPRGLPRGEAGGPRP